MDGFTRELADLRVKYKIPDLYFVAEINFLNDDGSEGEAFSVGGFGEWMKHERMLAYAFGAVQGDRQERIARLLIGDNLKQRGVRK